MEAQRHQIIGKPSQINVFKAVVASLLFLCSLYFDGVILYRTSKSVLKVFETKRTLKENSGFSYIELCNCETFLKRSFNGEK